MKKIASPHLGGFFTTYTSGDGCIKFIHRDLQSNATSVEVPYHVCEVLKPENYALTTLNGQIVAYLPVKRASESLLVVNNTLYNETYPYSNNGKG